MSKYLKITLGIGTAGFLFGFVGMWWWAIFGMSPNIGEAVIGTSVALLMIGIFGSIVGLDL